MLENKISPSYLKMNLQGEVGGDGHKKQISNDKMSELQKRVTITALRTYFLKKPPTSARVSYAYANPLHR